VTARSRRGELSTIFDEARAASAPASARNNGNNNSPQQQQKQQEKQQQPLDEQLQPGSGVEPAGYKAVAAG
jgi:hypothetical protein